MRNILFKCFRGACIAGLFFLIFINCRPLPGTRNPAVVNGVSEELARHRKAAISDLRYTLDLDIPAGKSAPILATEKIYLTLKNNRAPLQLDFKGDASQLKSLVVNGQPVPINYRQEHLVIPGNSLKSGGNEIKIEFIAGNMSLNRNEDYLYTLLVPDRARTLIPVFDQPDLKATYTLSLTIPSDWKALANAPLRDSTRMQGQRKKYQFASSDTLSTYLFSFVTGKFNQISRTQQNQLMHFYHRETDKIKLEQSLDPIFKIHADALKFMADYTLIPYPFRKFDFVAIPDFQYGGMEHVGAIDYKASTLFLDEGATTDQKISRSNLIAHETAHMWFGDLVTMQWFNDVWMKEVFANFMADKITQVSLPNSDYNLKFLVDHLPAAYSIDRTAGANPIRQKLENLQDAGNLYGNIIYHKAPVMMRQLEKLMGEKAFREGLQVYLKTFAYANATWPDLIRILDERTSADLKAWNQVWVNEPGRPIFDYTLQTADNKITQLVIKQKAEDHSNRIWPQAFDISLVYPNEVVVVVPVTIYQKQMQVPAATGKKVPDYILFNSSGIGYGVFPTDEKMLPQLATVKSPVARAAAYISLYENMLNGRFITPEKLLHTYRAILSQETEELNLKLLTGQLGSIYWRFMKPETRRALAPTLEKEIWEAMEKTRFPNFKKLLFKTYQNITLTKAAQTQLYQIWEKEQAPAGVKLTEDDFTSLAQALALREYAAPDILLRQLRRIQNPDRRKAFQFTIPALASEPAARDAFFASLKEEKNREKETYVLAALHYLHHPLRTASSEKYLLPSLQLLQEIQLTGDIFFPYSWLQATFGSYQTPSAAQTVRTFLRDNPGYNPRLRAKILQATDDLFRAEKLLTEKGN